VIDVSNSPTPDDAAKGFVDTAATNLLEAQSQAGVSHPGVKLAARHGRSAFRRLADVARPRRPGLGFYRDNRWVAGLGGVRRRPAERHEDNEAVGSSCSLLVVWSLPRES
jgi:hypothetical protein